MNKIEYRKDGAPETQVREVEAIGYRFGERDLVVCIDVADLTDEDKEILQTLREEYIESLYEAGFSSSFRSFHADSIEGVIE